MTHAELRRDHLSPPGTALEPTDCEGLLDQDAAGLIVARIPGEWIRVFRCTLCGHTIVQDVGSGLIVNDYVSETYADLVRRLAAGMLVGGGK